MNPPSPSHVSPLSQPLSLSLSESTFSIASLLAGNDVTLCSVCVCVCVYTLRYISSVHQNKSHLNLISHPAPHFSAGTKSTVVVCEVSLNCMLLVCWFVFVFHSCFQPPGSLSPSAGRLFVQHGCCVCL